MSELKVASPPVPSSHAALSQNRSMRIGFTIFLLVVLWGIACRFLSSEWSINEQYNYGWFVPFIAAYLFWLRWERRPPPERQAGPALSLSNVSRRGLFCLAVLFALLLLLPLRLFEIGNPDWRPLGWLHVAIAASVTFAILYLSGGKPWLRHFVFPIAFFFVAVPWLSVIEAPIVAGLMQLVAGAASETLALCGIPAQVEGNLIRISTGVVGVNEACSGVRSLQTSLMIGLLFGELKNFSLLRRLFLVCAAVLIALLGNFCRALFLVWIASMRSVVAISSWHDATGYAIVAAVVLGSIALATILQKNQKAAPAPTSPESERKPARLIPVAISLAALFWIVVVELGAEAWYRIHERNVVSGPQWKIKWPESNPAFRQIVIDEGIRQTLRFDEGREALWKLTGTPDAPGEQVTTYMFFFRWNPGSSSVLRARAHRPDICLPSAGWRQIGSATTKNYSNPNGIILPVRFLSFAQEHGSGVACTFFCLQEDKTRSDEPRPDLELPEGQQPDWSFPARLRVVRNGVRNLGQQVLEIAFVAPHPISATAAKAQFEDLLRQVVISR